MGSIGVPFEPFDVTTLPKQDAKHVRGETGSTTGDEEWSAADESMEEAERARAQSESGYMFGLNAEVSRSFRSQLV